MLGARKQVVLGGDEFRDEYSIYFDGTNDYITSSTLTFTDSMSFSFWVKTDSSGSGAFLTSYEDGSNAVTIGTYNDKVDARFAGANTISRASDTWTHAQWNYVVCVCDSGTATTGLTVYINGVVSTTSTSNSLGLSDATGTVIGARNHSSSYGYDYEGYISDIAVYNTLLTASQVNTLYNGREPYNHKDGIVSGNLTAWWRMGDGKERGIGTTVYDESSGTNNGTMINNSSFSGDTP
jgi:hypothetical protein